jgi:hypothetical protein
MELYCRMNSWRANSLRYYLKQAPTTRSDEPKGSCTSRFTLHQNVNDDQVGDQTRADGEIAVPSIVEVGFELRVPLCPSRLFMDSLTSFQGPVSEDQEVSIRFYTEKF